MNDRVRSAHEANLVEAVRDALHAGATWEHIGAQLNGGLTRQAARGWFEAASRRHPDTHSPLPR
jgi:hypothetical protein